MFRLSVRVIVLGMLFVMGGSASAETVWTWNQTETAHWNGSGNWLKNGATSTETPARDSSDQTINIEQGTVNNGSIDLNFSTTTINVTGTGVLQQLTTHHSRMSSGAMNVTNGGTVIMCSNNWLLGSGQNKTYFLTVDGGTFIPEAIPVCFWAMVAG